MQKVTRLKEAVWLMRPFAAKVALEITIECDATVKLVC